MKEKYVIRDFHPLLFFYLIQAIAARPAYWKNYLRAAACCAPGIRGLIWSRAERIDGGESGVPLDRSRL
jgi:hypothetical protein